MSPIRLNEHLNGASGPVGPQVTRRSADHGSFAGELEAQLLGGAGIKLSAHAQKRLAQRNVELGETEQARLRAAVDRIGQKGADKSLVLMDDLALLVSARNRTVITAIDCESAKEGVFTNIDSAVII